MPLLPLKEGRGAPPSEVSAGTDVVGDLGYRKDCAPEETVSRIRGLLANAGIEVHEFEVLSNGRHLHSARVELAQLPGCGCNGKGTTQGQARASAYGELMERVQNRFLSGIFPYYGAMPGLPESLDPPDQVHVPIGEYLRERRQYLELFIEPPLERELFPADCEVIGLPYQDVDGGTNVLLPHALLSAGTSWSLLNRVGSTGMCAGNSQPEAVCQGLCEIAERYVTKQVYLGRPEDFPSVPLELLHGRAVRPIIDEVLDKHLRLMVKDCTLGGLLPVIGTIVIDDESNAMLRLGSDPSLDVALARCLTESFQGSSHARHPKNRQRLDLSESQFEREPFWDAPKNRLRQFILSTRDGSSEIPAAFLLAGTARILPGGFADHTATSLEALRFVTERIRGAGGRIFLRDVSFLGFPAFHVFVKGMSNVLLPRLTWAEVRARFERAARSKDLSCVLSLRRATETQIAACAEALELYWKNDDGDPLLHETVRTTPTLSWAGRLVLRPDFDSPFLQEGDYLLALLFFRAGDYKRAFEYLDSNLRRLPCQPEQRQYMLGVLAYFRLMAENRGASEIRQTLQGLLDDGLAGGLSRELSDKAQVFRDLRLPDCGECSRCQLQHACCYEGWRSVHLALRGRLSQYRPQEAVGVPHEGAIWQP